MEVWVRGPPSRPFRRRRTQLRLGRLAGGWGTLTRSVTKLARAAEPAGENITSKSFPRSGFGSANSVMMSGGGSTLLGPPGVAPVIASTTRREDDRRRDEESDFAAGRPPEHCGMMETEHGGESCGVVGEVLEGGMLWCQLCCPRCGSRRSWTAMTFGQRGEASRPATHSLASLAANQQQVGREPTGDTPLSATGCGSAPCE